MHLDQGFLNLIGQFLIGLVTGIPRVGMSHTVPVPANTVPVMGTGTYRTVICMVSDETRGITLTHGILIIKIIKISISITWQYLQTAGGGDTVRRLPLKLTKFFKKLSKGGREGEAPLLLYCCCSHWGCVDVQAHLFARSCPSLSPSLPSWAIPWYLYQKHVSVHYVVMLLTFKTSTIHLI